MKNNHNTILVFILFIFIPHIIFCQKTIFEKVPSPEGESFQHITGITQDSNGFIWLATKNGLYRHDGIQMIRYKHTEFDQNSIASNELESICVDSTGSIWIGTVKAGIDKFDPSSEKFIHYRHEPNNANSLSSDYVSALLTDNEGILWIGTKNGLDNYNILENKFTHFVNTPGDSNSLSCNEVSAIYEDKESTLWIGTGSVYVNDNQGGLNKMNKTEGTFTRFMQDPLNSNSLINNKVRAILEDNKGNFWVGTAGDGLHTMDRKTGKFTRYAYDPLHPNKLSRPQINRIWSNTDHITFIKEDIAGNVWIGTSESGINCYNPETKQIMHYEAEDAENSFSSRTSWWAFSSMEGIFWISDMSGHLYRVNPFQKEFLKENVINSEVNCFYEDFERRMWIGTNQGLVFSEDSISLTYLTNYIKNKISPNINVNFIINDSNSNIWVGGDRGLLKITKENKEITHYKHEPKNKNSLSSDYVASLAEDIDGNLWIGTLSGLDFFNQKSETIKSFFIDSSAFNQDKVGLYTILSVLIDEKNRIWIGTYFNGLQLFNQINKSFKKYIEDILVTQIFEDRNKDLWVGSNNGLYKYDSLNDRFINYNQLNMFNEIPVIISIIEDDQNFLWLKTTIGIVRLNSKNDELTIFGKNYGINPENLNWQSSYKSRNGNLFLGNFNGYYTINPKELPPKSIPPKIVITAFRVSDQLISKNDNIISKEITSNEKEIQLSYSQNIFSLDFASIDYSSIDYSKSFNSQLLYKLDNYDISWRKAGNDRRAYYFNVPPGNYIFKIKASNSYGLWSEKQLAITINSPWWKTWWAYTLFILGLLGILGGVRKFELDRRKEKENKKLLQLENERKTKEIEQAKEIEKAYTKLKSTQAQLIHAEKMASLGELTAGIAHEIKNPLNFVNNFSELSRELIEEMTAELEKDNKEEALELVKNLKQNLEKINHHGKRADSIVKGMLLHSRGGSGDKVPTNINDLLDQFLSLAYHGMRAQDKEFNLSIEKDYDKSLEKINVVPQDISRVFLNIINNACYAAYERKKKSSDINFSPTLRVSTKNLNEKVEIRIGDNGNGIPPEIVDKIFQPFFTTKPTGQGTGLGLSLAYDIVKAHSGELKIETTTGEGSTFTIYLPVN